MTVGETVSFREAASSIVPDLWPVSFNVKTHGNGHSILAAQQGDGMEYLRFKIKLLHWPEAGHYAIVITDGLLDVQGFLRIFYAVGRATEALLECKILIDCEEAICGIRSSDMHWLQNRLKTERPASKYKIALVSGPRVKQHAELCMLGGWLSVRGLEAAVFEVPKQAAAWLAQPSRSSLVS